MKLKDTYSLDCNKIQAVHPKGDQSWVFIGQTDAEAETPILWPPHAKSWLIGKDPDAGRNWGQEEKGMTEDEMAGWHLRLDGHGVWVNSGSWWWTGRPGVLRFMGLQRVGRDWATELNWDCNSLPVNNRTEIMIRIELPPGKSFLSYKAELFQECNLKTIFNCLQNLFYGLLQIPNNLENTEKWKESATPTRKLLLIFWYIIFSFSFLQESSVFVTLRMT